MLGRIAGTTGLLLAGAVLSAPPAHAARNPDVTAPTVTVWSPVTGATVAVGEPLSAEFACAEQVVDAEQSSGLASCLGSWGPSNAPLQSLAQVGPGQPMVASQPGSYVLYVFGKDVAGNSRFVFTSWTAVAASGTDTVDPGVVVTSPAAATEVTRGSTLLAGYSCSDAGSGIASCKAPVADGQPLDTSTLGSHRFSAVAVDAAGNLSREVRTYTVVETAPVTVSGTVTSQAASTTVAGATLRFVRPGTDDLVGEATTDAVGHYSVSVPAGTYDVVSRGPAGSRLGATFYRRAAQAAAPLDLALPQLSVTLTLSLPPLAPQAGFTLRDENGTTVSEGSLAGTKSRFQLPAGTYSLDVQQNLQTPLVQFKGTRTIAAEDDTAVVISPPVHPVTLRAVDAEGDPAPGAFSFHCVNSTPDWPVIDSRGFQRRPSDDAAGAVVHLADASPASTCPVTFDPDHGPTRTEQVPSGATSYTFGPVTGIHLTGTIHDPTGAPLGDTLVNAYDADGNATGDSTTSTGAFDLEVVPGTHTVEVAGAYGEAFQLRQLTLPLASHTTDAVLDLDPVVDEVTVHVTGPGGVAARAQVEVSCEGVPLGQSRVARESLGNYTTAPTGTAHLYGVAVANAPGDGCLVRARSTADPGNVVQQSFTVPDGGGDVTIEVDPGVTVSGQVSVPGVTAFAPGATAYVGDASGPVAADGTFTVENAPSGSAIFVFSGSADGWSRIGFSRPVTVSDGSPLEVEAEVDLLRLHVLGPDGAPGTASATLACDGALAFDNTTTYTVTRSGSSPLELPGYWGSHNPGTSGPECTLTVTRPGGSETTVAVQLDADATTTLTIAGADGTVTPGTPTSSVDGDDVPDAVEAYAANGGDGNFDGVPDSEQPDVTSLPSGGGVLGDGSLFLTIAVTGGGTLGSVSTRATSSVATPPPAQLTLPSGLVEFQVTGLTAGATRTVALYPPSTAGVTGYAKYDADTGAWSQLPAGRVAVFADRVEITLTDGGIGDDDGVADGVITDPGGIVIDSYASDQTGPSITFSGPSSGATYVLGAVPTPGCVATDAGSGPAGCSVVTTGGTSSGVGTRTLVATATDLAGNTSTSRRSYHVVYGFARFAQPVNTSGASSVFKKGSTVAVRFRLTDSTGHTVSSSAAPAWLKPVRGAKKSGKVNEAVSHLKPDTGSAFRSRSGLYEFRWGTAKATSGRSYRLGVRLDDETVHTVVVVIR